MNCEKTRERKSSSLRKAEEEHRKQGAANYNYPDSVFGIDLQISQCEPQLFRIIVHKESARLDETAKLVGILQLLEKQVGRHGLLFLVLVVSDRIIVVHCVVAIVSHKLLSDDIFDDGHKVVVVATRSSAGKAQVFRVQLTQPSQSILLKINMTQSKQLLRKKKKQSDSTQMSAVNQSD